MNDSDLINVVTLITQNSDKATRGNILSFILSLQPPNSYRALRNT